MKNITLLAITLLINVTVIGQEKFIQESVYFKKDKFFLTNESILTLSSLYDTINVLDLNEIELSGNTDSDASQEYNIELSKNRCISIQKYFISKGISDSNINILYYGEDKPISTNTSIGGMQKNRRVDIIIKYSVLPKEIIKSIPESKDLCKEDTNVILPSGSMFVFNKCEYLEKKDCFEIDEFFTPDELRENNLTTLDDKGQPLESGGMFDFPIKQNSKCKNLCFKTPVIIRIPIPGNCSLSSLPYLYSINEDGAWSQQDRFKLINIDNLPYYEITITCFSGKMNCDSPTSGNLFKVKFKINRKYEIVNVNLSGDCPLYSYNLGPLLDKKQNIVKFKNKKRYKTYELPCYVKNGNFEAIVIDKKSKDTLFVETKPLRDLNKTFTFTKCKTRTKKIFWFIYKKDKLSRKYKIKKMI